MGSFRLPPLSSLLLPPQCPPISTPERRPNPSRELSGDTIVTKSESTGGKTAFPPNRSVPIMLPRIPAHDIFRRTTPFNYQPYEVDPLTGQTVREEGKPGNGNVWDISPWHKPNISPMSRAWIPPSLWMSPSRNPLPEGQTLPMPPEGKPYPHLPAQSNTLSGTENSPPVAVRRRPRYTREKKTGSLMERRKHSRQDSDQQSAVLGPLVDPDTDKLKARTRWMSSIPNNTRLSHLSVPGSHDSAAHNYKGEQNEFQNRQSIPIFRQLDAGIRALDLRYTCHRGSLRLAHPDNPNLGEELEDVIWGLNAWLQIRPSETIFVSLKLDESCVQDGNAKRLMKDLLDNTANFWVENPTTCTTLEEARGKLVLLRRFPSDEACGLDLSAGWSANSSYFRLPLDPKQETFSEVEDFFLLRGHPRDAEQQVDLKLDSIISHLERAQKARMEESDHLYITFSSAIGDQSDPHLHAGVNPKVLALGRGDISGVNGNLAEWLEHSPKRSVGIIFMDFATAHRNVPDGEDKDTRDEGSDLIQAIINMNRLT